MGQPTPNIAVRFNFEKDVEGKQNIEKIVNNLIDKKLVDTKSEWSAFVTTPSVIKGTEISTKCAFAFIDWMNKNSTILNNYLGDSEFRINFTSRLILILLQNLGFRTHYENYPLSEDDIKIIRDCAEYCASQIREDFNQAFDVDFMERIIHHFFNCIYVDTIKEEPNIWVLLFQWEWLGNLLDNRLRIDR